MLKALAFVLLVVPFVGRAAPAAAIDGVHGAARGAGFEVKGYSAVGGPGTARRDGAS